MDKKEFISFVKKHVEQYDVKLYLSKAKRVNCDGMKTNGFFDDVVPNRKLAVATGDNVDWFWVFVHEYCHFTQWVEKAKVWTDYDKKVKHWHEYCTGENTDVVGMKMKLQNEYEAVRNVELDCEKRVIKMIKKYNLPIDVESYTRNGNAYVYFYTHVRDNPGWYKKKAPYKVKQILNIMPTKFLNANRYNKLPENYSKLVNRYCF